MFKRAMTNKTVTENGMVTNKVSGSALVDLFFKMGASRQVDETSLENSFKFSFNENPLYTLRAMFYNRDIRGGQGERRSFKIFLKWLITNHPELAHKVMPLVPEYGRWDDLFVAVGTGLENRAFQIIAVGLRESNKLCAKWMPREKKANNDVAVKLMKYLELSPREYRKLLAGNTEVVETLMCNREWAGINYSHVPSVASNRYRKAFWKNDEERYGQWVEDVTKGVKKVNAGALYPHDLVHQVISGWGISNDRTLRASADNQWKALPNYVPEGKRFLPVCDTSGSMSGIPIEVCISLGIYLSERNVGEFQNLFITFSGNPKFQEIVGADLYEKVQNLNSADWAMNTDLERVFSLILNRAISASLTQEDMPSSIIILSDMQFDQAVRKSDSALEMIKRKYETAGYQMPGIVFWNLRDSNGVPATVNDKGVALVSGFSPSIMKTVFSGELSPLATVIRTLDQERYASINL